MIPTVFKQIQNSEHVSKITVIALIITILIPKQKLPTVFNYNEFPRRENKFWVSFRIHFIQMILEVLHQKTKREHKKRLTKLLNFVFVNGTKLNSIILIKNVLNHLPQDPVQFLASFWFCEGDHAFP